MSMVDGMGESNPSDALSAAEDSRQAKKEIAHDLTDEMREDVSAPIGYQKLQGTV
jgi:hypothetical protein